MGMANWNLFGCDYDDTTFRTMADAMVSTGLAAKGYSYMLVQECIVPLGARDPVTGVVQPNATKFPHGLASLADYFHSKGLKAGIYTDVKSITCAGYEGSGPGPGAPSHWALDALTYAQWGFDMIEADFCNSAGSNASAYELYREARDAIAAATAATGRTIAFYICNWGVEQPWQWAPEVGNLFRNTGDICAPGSIAFGNILHNFDNTVIHSSTPPARPGLPGTGIGAWNGQ
jgi:alpha-galactosidase